MSFKAYWHNDKFLPKRDTISILGSPGSFLEISSLSENFLQSSLIQRIEYISLAMTNHFHFTFLTFDKRIIKEAAIFLRKKQRWPAYQTIIVACRKRSTSYTITRNPKQITASIQCNKKRNIWRPYINPCVMQPKNRKTKQSMTQWKYI